MKKPLAILAAGLLAASMGAFAADAKPEAKSEYAAAIDKARAEKKAALAECKKAPKAEQKACKKQADTAFNKAQADAKALKKKAA